VKADAGRISRKTAKWTGAPKIAAEVKSMLGEDPEGLIPKIAAPFISKRILVGIIRKVFQA